MFCFFGYYRSIVQVLNFCCNFSYCCSPCAYIYIYIFKLVLVLPLLLTSIVNLLLPVYKLYREMFTNSENSPQERLHFKSLFKGQPEILANICNCKIKFQFCHTSPNATSGAMSKWNHSKWVEFSCVISEPPLRDEFICLWKVPLVS